MTTMRRVLLAGRGRRPLVLVLCLTTSWLAACEGRHFLTSEEALIEQTPAKAHRISFVERDDVLEVELPPHRHGLSHNQYVDVFRFGRLYGQEATGPIELGVPGGRHNAHEWNAAIADARRALRAAGVPSNVIVVDASRRRNTLTVAYHRPEAVAPNCGNWPTNAGRDPERIHYHDFGCATQRNLAGMAANGRDLMLAQQETPASSERRSRNWSKYTLGDAATAGAQPPSSDPQTDTTKMKKSSP